MRADQASESWQSWTGILHEMRFWLNSRKRALDMGEKLFQAAQPMGLYRHTWNQPIE